MRNIAICSTVVAMVAPVTAQANDAVAMAKVSQQVTVIVNGATYGGSLSTLSASQLASMRAALQGVISGAAASGLTIHQIMVATSEGLAASEAGAWATSIGNSVATMVYDLYIGATSVTIPASPIWITIFPDGGYGELGYPAIPEMAHLYQLYPNDYYGNDDYEEGVDSEHNDGYASDYGEPGGYGEGDGYEGSGSTNTTSSSPDTEDTYNPGGDRPHTQYDSSQHDDGYWTNAGCFPPTPGGYYLTAKDAMVPCTGREVEAPVITIPAVDIRGNTQYMVDVYTIPFGAEVLLLPVEDSPNIVPTIVHFF